MGISISEIEKLETEYDIRDYNELLKEIGRDFEFEQKKSQILKLVEQINIADAVYYGMVATQTNKGYNIYKRWRDRLIVRINILNGKKQLTVWDKMKRKSNKI